MKKLLSLAACLVAVTVVAVSCTPKDKPDGKCELTAFSLSSSIAGTIDATAKTITVVIPTSVTSDSFTPTFTVTDYDVVTIGGTPATSGETAVTIADGTKVIVADEVSAMTTEYTIVVKMNDQQAELVSLVFPADNNSLLDEDVAPEAISSEMIVRVPGEAFRKELTLAVTAGDYDEIKVNGNVVASGSTVTVDTSFPIDITVTDAVAGKSVNYVLKVGKILEYILTDLGQYSEGTIADLTMEINPNDNLPYFGYTRKVGDESYNNMSVAKWNGSAFELVGPTGLADASARNATMPKLAFGKDGSVYAFCAKADVNYLATVRKLESDWVLVGPAGNTPQRYNDSYYYPFFVHPSSGQPFFLWNANTNGQANRRTMSVAYFANDAWQTATITGVIPAVEGTTGMFFGADYAESNGKAYVVSQFNQYGYYIHEVAADGSLTTVVENCIPEGTDAATYHGLAGNLQIKAGVDGALYVLAAVRGGEGSMQVFSVDKEAGTLKPYGPGLPVAIGASGGIDQAFALAVNPVDGLTVVASAGEETSSVKFLDDNMQWATLADGLPKAKIPYYADFNANGECFISYVVDGKIQLYKVALEADILPE